MQEGIVVNSLLGTLYSQADLNRLITQWALSPKEVLCMEMLHNGSFQSGKFCVDPDWISSFLSNRRNRGEINEFLKLVPGMLAELQKNESTLRRYLLGYRVRMESHLPGKFVVNLDQLGIVVN